MQPTHSTSQSERARTLRAVRDRVSAEIAGVENGVLPLIEDSGRPVDTREVAGRLGMSIPGANNALKALWLAGLIEREPVLAKGGGRAYLYTVADHG
jgi:predicted transcriptional regulator